MTETKMPRRAANASAFDAYLRDPPQLSYVEPSDPWPRRASLAVLERACGQRALQNHYQGLKATAQERFFEEALARLGVTPEFQGPGHETGPAPGPTVFVANHPFGIIDGLVLCAYAKARYGDFRILLHARLCQDRDLQRYFLPVDFTESRAAMLTNLETGRAARAALDAGVPVLIFPAGAVSTRQRLGFGALTEAPWRTFTAKLLAQSQATVVPTFFHGENSRVFHVASHFSQALRYALLLRETHRRGGKPCRVTLGAPIPWETLAALGSRQAITDHLQAATWCLKDSA